MEGTGKSMKNALHADMAKGTSRAEATSNSKKNQAHSLAIVKLRLSEGISQSVRLLVENSIKYIFLNYAATFWNHFRLIWKLIWT